MRIRTMMSSSSILSLAGFGVALSGSAWAQEIPEPEFEPPALIDTDQYFEDVWSQRWLTEGPAGASMLAVGPTGDTYAAGRWSMPGTGDAAGISSGNGISVFRQDGDDGHAVWGYFVDEPANGPAEHPVAIAASQHGIYLLSYTLESYFIDASSEDMEAVEWLEVPDTGFFPSGLDTDSDLNLRPAHSADWKLRMLSHDGALLWETTLSSNLKRGQTYDVPTDLAVDPNGIVYITGSMERSRSLDYVVRYQTDAVLRAFSPMGDAIGSWSFIDSTMKFEDGTSSAMSSGDQVKISPAGEVFWLVRHYNSDADPTSLNTLQPTHAVQLAKLSTDGNVVYQHWFKGDRVVGQDLSVDGLGRAALLLTKPDGNYNEDDVEEPTGIAAVYSFGANGALQWQDEFSEYEHQMAPYSYTIRVPDFHQDVDRYAVGHDAEGDVFLAGTGRIEGTFDRAAYVRRYSSAGEHQWTRPVLDMDHGLASMAVTTDGQVWIGGARWAKPCGNGRLAMVDGSGHLDMMTSWSQTGRAVGLTSANGSVYGLLDPMFSDLCGNDSAWPGQVYRWDDTVRASGVTLDRFDDPGRR
jgi:hypothetical protein